jgi:hypothetical protein
MRERERERERSKETEKRRLKAVVLCSSPSEHVLQKKHFSFLAHSQKKNPHFYGKKTFTKMEKNVSNLIGHFEGKCYDKTFLRRQ